MLKERYPGLIELPLLVLSNYSDRGASWYPLLVDVPGPASPAPGRFWISLRLRIYEVPERSPWLNSHPSSGVQQPDEAEVEAF